MSANPLDADADLEIQIETACALMGASNNEADQRTHWVELVRLVHQRSPETVARMEAERGLTRKKQ
jgi:hypothetical protein